MKLYEARGNSAARLRQRKHALLGRFQIPANALPGSLSQTHRRCGKPTCHCTDGEGHPIWSLTFMADGKRHVERIPDDWVEQIRPLVEQGREFKDAVAEVFAANAQLLTLRRQEETKAKKKRAKKR
jgi:hypothetical protein